MEKFDICFIAGSGLLSKHKSSETNTIQKAVHLHFVFELLYKNRNRKSKFAFMVWILQFWNSFVCSFVLSESFLQTGGERFLFLQVLDWIQGSRKPKSLMLVLFQSSSATQLGWTEGNLHVSPMLCQWYSKHHISWLKDLKPLGDFFFVESDSSTSQTMLSHTFYPVLCSFNLPIYI